MRRRLVPLALTTIALVAAACSESPVEPTLDGPVAPPEGSDAELIFFASTAAEVQAALDAPLLNPFIRIVSIRGDIELDAPLTYDGPQHLKLYGRNATITGPNGADCDGVPAEACNALTVESAGGLTLSGVTIQGARDHGVLVDIPGSARGTVRFVVRNATLQDNGLAGIWIDDQTNDSPASLGVTVQRSRILRNGFKEGEESADFDGMRVNEGGFGDLSLGVYFSEVDGNAADGIELDEKGDGNASALLLRTSFLGNGEQPQLFDPATDENSDPEDGFDIDEAGPGHLYARIFDVDASDNFDEGIDLDEEGAGDANLYGHRIEASRNVDEGIKVSEDADLEDAVIPAEQTGSLIIRLVHVEADDGKDNDGIQLEEFGRGDAKVWLTNVQARDNFDKNIAISEDTGLEDASDPGFDTGDLLFRMVRVTATGAGDGDGIQAEEYGAGDVDGRIVNSVATGNDSDDLQVQQNDAGSGVLRLVNVTYDETNFDGVTVIEN